MLPKEIQKYILNFFDFHTQIKYGSFTLESIINLFKKEFTDYFKKLKPIYF